MPPKQSQHNRVLRRAGLLMENCSLKPGQGGPLVAELRNLAKRLGLQPVPRSRVDVCALLQQHLQTSFSQSGRLTKALSSVLSLDECNLPPSSGGPRVAELRQKIRQMGVSNVPR